MLNFIFKLATHKACVGDLLYIYQWKLIWKPEENKPIGGPKRRWKETGYLAAYYRIRRCGLS
jgi:hypothetical protein